MGTGNLSIGAKGSALGDIYAGRGGTVTLEGGTAKGALTVDESSTLAGFGVISGPANVTGQIIAGKSPGAITFQAAPAFEVATIFIWTLFHLVDDATTGLVNQWNWLVFNTAAPGATIIEAPVNIVFDMTQLGAKDPNSTHAFWTKPHKWKIYESEQAEFLVPNTRLQQPTFTAGYFEITADPGNKTLSLEFVVSPEA